MRYTLRCCKLNGDSVYYDNVHFITTSSENMTIYFKEKVIHIQLKNYRYIKLIPNEEGKDGK